MYNWARNNISPSWFLHLILPKYDKARIQLQTKCKNCGWVSSHTHFTYSTIKYLRAIWIVKTDLRTQLESEIWWRWIICEQLCLCPHLIRSFVFLFVCSNSEEHLTQVNKLCVYNKDQSKAQHFVFTVIIIGFVMCCSVNSLFCPSSLNSFQLKVNMIVIGCFQH